MSDNGDERLDRLFAAARNARVDTSALEEHFETRLMARLRERRREGIPWYALMWRMVPVFAVLVVLIAVYSASYRPPSPATCLRPSVPVRRNIWRRTF